MLPYFSDLYANPASKHSAGQVVKEATQKARLQVASLLNCSQNEIYFTSGATEAINTAIKGIAFNFLNKGKHIITAKTEHSAVLDVCKYLEKLGYEITYLDVNKDGLIDIDEYKNSLRYDTILVCTMHVNNETGVIQPIQEFANIAKENGTIFMTDATQSVGKLPISLKNSDIDILTFSGHKFHGPKGIGTLYIKKKFPESIRIMPLLHGGGQENGFRSGTLNTPSIVGLGYACELAQKEMQFNKNYIADLRDNIEEVLLKMPGAFLNGSLNKRIHNVLNIGFKGVDSDALLAGLENIALSKGSACSANSINPSHVLTAMGLSEKDAFSSIRISLSKYNNQEEIEFALKKITNLINSIRD